MSEHRYPTDALIGDYLRAGAGMALTGLPLLLTPLNPYVVAVLAGLTALFGVFGLLTALRHLRRVELGDDGIALVGPFPARLAWAALENVSLRYFATRRDGAKGWMELRLAGEGRRVMLDSRIEGFDRIARQAAVAAERRHLSLNPTTTTNFAALGIRMAPGAGE
ncbi:MAG TPA: hypothetical protein VMG55_01155 [Stellaceae bacterium]|nr:hypothetical protein [Stellaceae bacterium]